MTENERLESIPVLKEKGNAFYKQGNHEAACKKYSEALGRLEQLMLRCVNHLESMDGYCSVY